jgi:hypothetical protein
VFNLAKSMKNGRKAGKLRGFVRSAAVLGVVVAGACTGYIASVALGESGSPTYCSYLYGQLSTSQKNALTQDGFTLHFVGQGNYYICQLCGSSQSISGCGNAPTFPTPLNPNNPPNAQIVTHSTSCGQCVNPG